MRASVHLTHHRGIRLGEHQHHPRGELTGELLTHKRTSKRGVLTVATLRDPNIHIAEPMIELFDVCLYLIGPQGLHLRGLEHLAIEGRSQFVTQGRVVVTGHSSAERKENSAKKNKLQSRVITSRFLDYCHHLNIFNINQFDDYLRLTTLAPQLCR